MGSKPYVQRASSKSRIGILIGIPVLLFMSGVVIISLATYRYASYGFFLSRIFMHEEVKIQKQSTLEEAVGTMKYPKYGQEFGTLSINRIGISYPVYEGDSDDILLKGIGHFNGSRYPGEGSNVVMLAHRNSFFKNLKEIQKGDTVVCDLQYGQYTYKVSGIKIVNANDESILQPSSKEFLTLYTCYPFDYIGHAPKRYVVTCDLIGQNGNSNVNNEGGK